MSLRRIVLLVLGLQLCQGIRFYCEYAVHSDYGFGCEVSFINLTSDLRTDDVSFSGTLSEKKRVFFVHIRESKVEYLPEQMLTYFPNMVNLAIWDSKLNLKQGNLFRRFTHLKILSLSRNEIDGLDEDTLSLMENLELIELQNNKVQLLSGNIFKNNKKLNFMSFKNNKIYLIDPQIFDPLTKLEVVDFRNNICVDENFYVAKGDLSAMKSSLRKCFENFYLTQYINYNQQQELNKITSYLDRLNEKLDEIANSNTKIEIKKEIPPEIEETPKFVVQFDGGAQKSLSLSDFVAKNFKNPETNKIPSTTESFEEAFEEIDFDENPQVTPKIQINLWGANLKPADPKLIKSQNNMHDAIISKFDEILNNSQNKIKMKTEQKVALPVYPTEAETTTLHNSAGVTTTTFDPFYYDYDDEI